MRSRASLSKKSLGSPIFNDRCITWPSCGGPTWNDESFLFSRAMTALAIGGEYSAVTATMDECIPKRRRGRTDSLILSGFPVGTPLAAAVSWMVLSNLPFDVSSRVGFGFGSDAVANADAAACPDCARRRWL